MLRGKMRYHFVSYLCEYFYVYICSVFFQKRLETPGNLKAWRIKMAVAAMFLLFLSLNMISKYIYFDAEASSGSNKPIT